VNKSVDLDECIHEKTTHALLRQILLNYLLASRVIRWPGGDGLTEDDVLDYYALAIAAGDVPDQHELRRRHGDKEIEAFFRMKGWHGNSLPLCYR
jgi:hypothetical protein